MVFIDSMSSRINEPISVNNYMIDYIYFFTFKKVRDSQKKVNKLYIELKNMRTALREYDGFVIVYNQEYN